MNRTDPTLTQVRIVYRKIMGTDFRSGARIRLLEHLEAEWPEMFYRVTAKMTDDVKDCMPCHTHLMCTSDTVMKLSTNETIVVYAFFVHGLAVLQLGIL